MSTVAKGMRQSLYEYHQLSAGKKIEFERNMGLEPAGIYLTDGELITACMIHRLVEVWIPDTTPRVVYIRVIGTSFGIFSVLTDTGGLPVLTDDIREAMMNTYKVWLDERES